MSFFVLVFFFFFPLVYVAAFRRRVLFPLPALYRLEGIPLPGTRTTTATMTTLVVNSTRNDVMRHARFNLV